jgi:hypothetical protein
LPSSNGESPRTSPAGAPAGFKQKHIERILAGLVGQLAVQIYREREVTGMCQVGGAFIVMR